jgi:hypothetical protein
MAGGAMAVAASGLDLVPAPVAADPPADKSLDPALKPKPAVADKLAA